MGSGRFKRGVFYTLTIISAFVFIAVILLKLYGERAVWGMILPEDEALIGDHEVPVTLNPDILNEDLIYLSNQLLNRTPYSTAIVDTAIFRSEFDSLINELNPGESKNLLTLFSLASLPMEDGIGGGHTNIPIIQRPLNWKFYPFYAYMFDDGLWIIKAGDSYSDIEGTQILEINQVPVENIYTKAKPFIPADNEMNRLDEFTAYLSYAGFLKQLGIVSENGILELTINHPNDGVRNVRIEPVRLFSFNGLKWGQTMQQQVDTWSPADPRPRTKNYRFEYIADKKAIYLQFNRVQNQEDESIAEFTSHLADFVHSNPVDRFIVDIRSNGGGNNQLIEPLIEFISGHPKIDRRGALYTLIGRRTYSAAGAFAMAMELRTKTLFVGEKSGFTPNHIGDNVKIALPSSRILVNIASRFWQDGGPYDTRDWVNPDLEIPLKFSHHKNDNDPALRASLLHEVSHLKEPVLSESEKSKLQNKLIGVYEFDPLRTLQIRRDSAGFANFHIRYIDDWAYSKIYPPNSESGHFTTDIKDVYLEFDEKGQLILDWKGMKKILQPQKEGENTTVDYLLAITSDSTISISHVSELFRDLKKRGILFDSNLEFQLNRTGYWLLNNNRPEDAVHIFELQTELFPVVANGYDSLGEGYLALSETAKAKKAFEMALQLDPGFAHAKRMLEQIGN